MNTRAQAKWIILGIAGIAFIIAALICYVSKVYTFVFTAAFVGCFLVMTSWKRLRLLKAAEKAVSAGRAEITVFYRDANSGREIQKSVIPVSADNLYFYGFSTEKNGICLFRWNRILRALDNERELKKDDLLSRIEN
ncbi:MAG: hypothetical protein LBG57_13755 [Treponema sp.]|jgi:hypothetical protein|nr:hypothetical protein [Treponema sp.]